MKRRCNNPNVNNYAKYGALGIRVCRRWDSFENFYDDMGSRPSVAHTLERIDNKLGYSFGNCKWATRKEQADNRSNNIKISNGIETLTQTEWSRKLGFSDSTIKMRIRRGMAPIDAICN